MNILIVAVCFIAGVLVFGIFYKDRKRQIEEQMAEHLLHVAKIKRMENKKDVRK